MSQRTDRVDELLRQEIGALLAKELADPRIGFTTITDVETSPDLRHAKVWVSVIGGRTDRVETLRALQASMGFVRHELGKRLRIKRIPELHIHLDDSAERGTRLLHLLGELESGVDPMEVTPFNESLPTPVKRLPHEGDAPDAGPGPERRCAGEAGHGAAPGAPVPPASKPRSSRHARAGARAWTGCEVVERGIGQPAAAAKHGGPNTAAQGGGPDAMPAGARGPGADDGCRRPRRPRPSTRCRTTSSRACAGRVTCSRSATRTRTRTRSAPCSASACWWRRSGAPRRRSARTPCRRCTRSCRGSTGSAPTRIRTGRTTCWSWPTARARSASAPSPPGTPGCSPVCPAWSSITTRPTTAPAPADWIDPGAAATCELVALLAVRLGLPLDLGDGALAAALMAGVVMDTATFAHPNATPRTLAVSAALVAAGAPLSDISRRLYRTKPDSQLRLFGRVLGRLETSPDAAGRLVHAAARGPRGDGCHRRPTPRGSSTSSPRPSPRRSRCCSRSRTTGRPGSRSAPGPAAWTRPS